MGESCEKRLLGGHKIEEKGIIVDRVDSRWNARLTSLA